LLNGWSERSPALAAPRIEMARLMEEQGDVQAAKKQLEEALVLEPQNSRGLAALGRIREQLGEPEQALADYERSLAMNQFQPQVAARVATLRAAVGQPTMMTPATDTRLVSDPARLNRY
jgi:Flp pilus assembly protein TadD